MKTRNKEATKQKGYWQYYYDFDLFSDEDEVV